MDRNQLYKTIFDHLPQRYKDLVEKEAGYAKIEQYEKLVVIAGLATIILSLVGAFLSPFDRNIQIALAVVGAIGGPLPAAYLLISIKAEKRKKKMENVLADALRLTSANIKAGNTTEKALMLSARDEFGPLAEEFRHTAMEVYAGEPINKSLKNMEKRVKSPLFSETIKLLADAIDAGANTADLLESSAEDVRKSLELRDEIKSSIRMYTVFIMMAAVVGAPLLFAISVHMAHETTEMWEDSGIEDIDQEGMDVGSEIGFDMEFEAPDLDTEFFTQFAMMAIAITNIFAALLISQISNGNLKYGAKYIPIFLAVSLTLFIIVRRGVESLMGGF